MKIIMPRFFAFTGNTPCFRYDNKNIPESFVLEPVTSDFEERLNDCLNAAKSGSLMAGIEMLLLAAHFYRERKTPPDALADYIGEILTEAAKNAGEKNGSKERYQNIAKSMNLANERGSGKSNIDDKKQHSIFAFMKWSIKLEYTNTKYKAASAASVVFNEGHDNCEKIYDKYEAHWVNELPCPSTIFLSRNHIEKLIILHKEFLLKAIMHIEREGVKNQFLRLIDK